jgi:hypothetical protein
MARTVGYPSVPLGNFAKLAGETSLGDPTVIVQVHRVTGLEVRDVDAAAQLLRDGQVGKVCWAE